MISTVSKEKNVLRLEEYLKYIKFSFKTSFWDIFKERLVPLKDGVIIRQFRRGKFISDCTTFFNENLNDELEFKLERKRYILYFLPDGEFGAIRIELVSIK